MSRQYDAKQSVLKAYPDDIESGVDLFFEILDISADDFEYEEGVPAAEYIYGDKARALRPSTNGATDGFPVNGIPEGNPDRSKFPYRWEGPRPSKAIIHKVINSYMGEDAHEHDNDQFLYHLANWDGHYTLNQRMKTAMEAENNDAREASRGHTDEQIKAEASASLRPSNNG